MNTQKAILAIDAVTAAIVNGVINTAFIDKLIYGELDNEFSPSAWQTVSDNNIDRYGNYKNWSQFWERASREDKELLLNYMNQ